MPKSLHLIHQGRRKRGGLSSQKPPLTLAEVRKKIKPPYRAEHLDLSKLKKAINQLNTK